MLEDQITYKDINMVRWKGKPDTEDWHTASQFKSLSSFVNAPTYSM